MSKTERRGFSIRIFLPDGSPDGLKIVEKSNWTGKGVVCPRALFGDAKKRAEFQKTGVYLLLGPVTESGLPQAYIGEGDPLRPRLEQHAAKKDFWTTAILFLSKDENLNKAHVQHLESRLLLVARDAKRCELENGNEPQLPSLSESDVAEVEGFLDEMLLCFPVLGVSIFERPAKPTSAVVTLFLEGRGIAARGYESAQGFVVLAGSESAELETPSFHPYLRELRMNLAKSGILKLTNGKLVLSQDYLFSSPSNAQASFSDEMTTAGCRGARRTVGPSKNFKNKPPQQFSGKRTVAFSHARTRSISARRAEGK